MLVLFYFFFVALPLGGTELLSVQTLCEKQGSVTWKQLLRGVYEDTVQTSKILFKLQRL